MFDAEILSRLTAIQKSLEQLEEKMNRIDQRLGEAVQVPIFPQPEDLNKEAALMQADDLAEQVEEETEESSQEQIDDRLAEIRAWCD